MMIEHAFCKINLCLHCSTRILVTCALGPITIHTRMVQNSRKAKRAFRCVLRAVVDGEGLVVVYRLTGEGEGGSSHWFITNSDYDLVRMRLYCDD